jgi:excisionase family DNA binding protein
MTPRTDRTGASRITAVPPPRRGEDPAGADPAPAAAPDERLAYSVNEAAQLTGLSRDLLYDEMRRGHLRYLKVGRRRLITRQHLEEFLSRSETQG